MADSNVSLSGLTESEAIEVHKYFIQGFIAFSAVALLAHILVWMWRPWIPGPEGYSSLNELNQTIQALLPMGA